MKQVYHVEGWYVPKEYVFSQDVDTPGGTIKKGHVQEVTVQATKLVKYDAAMPVQGYSNIGGGRVHFTKRILGYKGKLPPVVLLVLDPPQDRLMAKVFQSDEDAIAYIDKQDDHYECFAFHTSDLEKRDPDVDQGKGILV